MRKIYIFLAFEEKLSKRNWDEDKHRYEEDASCYHTKSFRTERR
jgi:hypothetical protein